MSKAQHAPESRTARMHIVGNTIRRWIASVAVTGLCSQLLLARVGAQIAPPEPRRHVAPTLSLGWTSLAYGRGGDQYYPGIAARAGVHAASYFAMTLIAERWPNLSRSGAGPGGRSVQLEGSFYPLGVRPAAPYVFAGIGHFEESPPDSPSGDGASGRSTSLGVGIHGILWRGFGARLEYLVRFDAGVGNEQGRVFLSYSPLLPRRSQNASTVLAVIYAPKRIGGPWHFAEPGYGIRTVSPLTARDGAALDLAVFHWRIFDPQRPFGYAWDTRAVLLMAGWHRTYLNGVMSAQTQLGPAGTLMIEGPDRGLLPGLYADVGVALRTRPAVVRAGAGWLWLSRSPTSSTAGTDQNAILVHAAVGF